MKKVLRIVLSSVLLLAISTSTLIAGAADSDGITYTHSVLGFSLTLPSGWAGRYTVEEKPKGADIDDESHLQDYVDMHRDINDVIETFRHTDAAPVGMPFTDVQPSDWFYDDVETAYGTGLINGKTATAFAPGDNLTYAEAVKLAACMFQLYSMDSVTLTNGSPVWYQSYVDFAKLNSIISKDYDWGATATRAGYMEIFANALPDDALEAINTIADGTIPDVPMTHASAAAIYKLYRAGILQGVDAAHNCNPSSNIRRSEVAVILTRMMDASKRQSFTIQAVAPPSETPPAAMQNGGSLAADGVIGADILYKGIEVSRILDENPEYTLGTPTKIEGPVYFYDGIELYYTSYVSNISGTDLSLFTIDGISLNKTRAELIDALGAPIESYTYEGYTYHDSDNSGSIRYHISTFILDYMVDFWFDDTGSAAYSVSIMRLGQ